MDELIKIKVIIPDNIGLDFEDAEIPKIVQIEKTEDEYLNFDGQTLSIVVQFIFENIASGVFSKIGEDIHSFLTKLVSKKKDGIALNFSVKTPDFETDFNFEGVSGNDLKYALDSFLVFLKTLKTPNTTIKESDLRFDNESKKWLPKEVLVDYFKQKMDEAMENLMIKKYEK